MITEQSLRDHPAHVKALTGITADQLWELVQQLAERLALLACESEAARARPVGRPCAHPLAVRVAAVLTYLRLHIPNGCRIALYHRSGGYLAGFAAAAPRDPAPTALPRGVGCARRPVAEPLPVLLLEQAAPPARHH